MAVEGTLDVFRLPEIFQVISHQRKTGILTVQGENDIVAVSFLEGGVVAADALNQTVEETIGDILEQQGILSRESFAEIAAEARAGEGRLLDLLVGRGLVDREGLLEALRVHTYNLLFELLGWDTGGFKFYSGDEVAYENGFRPIPIEELLLRAIAEGEEEGSEALPEQGLLYGRIDPPPREIRERFGPPRPGEEADTSLWVSSDETKVWELLAGPQSVDALVAATGLGEHQVRFALYRFLAAGVAEVHEGDESDLPSPMLAPPPLPDPAAGESTWGDGSWGAGGGGSSWRGTGGPVVEMPEPELAELELPELPAERSGWQWGSGRRAGADAAGDGSSAFAHVLALLLVVVMGSSLWNSASRFLIPFPWLAAERSADEALRFDGTAARIDRAAKTYYLLEGAFPDSLARLTSLGMLRPLDQRAPNGGAIAYSPAEGGYELRPTRLAGDGTSGWDASESVSGNFLLDSDFAAVVESQQAQPLILLD